AAAPSPDADQRRALSRIGPADVTDDLPSIAHVLQGREVLETLNGRLPSFLRVFNEQQLATVSDALNVPSLQTQQLLPVALSLVVQRLAAPWQVGRLAIRMAASDDELRVAATPYGIAVSIALHDLSCVAATLRADIKRGRFNDVAEHLKILHD